MMLISSWSLPHNDKGLGRKLAVDGLAHPNVAKSNTTPLISNHKLHPESHCREQRQRVHVTPA
jgi:hypothetical protein